MTSSTTTSEEDVNAAMMNPDATLENIPGKYSVKVETAVETIISCLGTTEGWDQLYEKKGLVAYKKTGISGSAVCVRGDYMIPLDIMAIFGMIYDLKRANLRDPQLNVAEHKLYYSIHTSIQYLRYKQVLLNTSTRDFMIYICNLSPQTIFNRSGLQLCATFVTFPIGGCSLTDGLCLLHFQRNSTIFVRWLKVNTYFNLCTISNMGILSLTILLSILFSTPFFR
jgi:hypothetical protein